MDTVEEWDTFEKVKYVRYFMFGPAEIWFEETFATEPKESWESFCEKVLHHFTNPSEKNENGTCSETMQEMAEATTKENLNKMLCKHFNDIHETLLILEESPVSSRDKTSWKNVMLMGEGDDNVATVDNLEWKGELEHFAKLLPGEDMAGGGRGVSTALAISNAITNLAATVFGELWKLEPLDSQKKSVWHREMEWLLCMTDSIVELIPAVQEFPGSGSFEIMVTQQRSDLYVNHPALKKLNSMLINVLDGFRETEFQYVDRGILVSGTEHAGASSQRPSVTIEEKWWLPFPKVPSNDLTEEARKKLENCKECTHQIYKAVVAKRVRQLLPPSLLCNWQKFVALNTLKMESTPNLENVLFDIWKKSYMSTCASVDQELRRQSGFDIGNDNCVIAVAKQRGVDVLLNNESKRENPTIISFDEKQRFIGCAGAASATMHPKSTVYQIKRLFGQNFNEPGVQEDLESLPFETSEGSDGQILIHLHYLNEKQTFTPVQILAVLLAHLKQVAEKNLEMKVGDCVVGSPSYFTAVQRRAYLQTAEIAGLKPLRLMHDCTAIGLGYGIYKTEFPGKGPANVAFVDIGHSDTQVAVISFEPGKMKVLVHSFDMNLGGRDFDKALFKLFAEQFKEHYKIDVCSNARASIRLRASCGKLKKVLTANAEAPLSIECLMEEKDVKGFIKREEFVKLSAEFMVNTLIHFWLVDNDFSPFPVEVCKSFGVTFLFRSVLGDTPPTSGLGDVVNVFIKYLNMIALPSTEGSHEIVYGGDPVLNVNHAGSWNLSIQRPLYRYVLRTFLFCPVGTSIKNASQAFEVWINYLESWSISFEEFSDLNELAPAPTSGLSNGVAKTSVRGYSSSWKENILVQKSAKG